MDINIITVPRPRFCTASNKGKCLYSVLSELSVRRLLSWWQDGSNGNGIKLPRNTQLFIECINHL